MVKQAKKSTGQNKTKAMTQEPEEEDKIVTHSRLTPKPICKS